MLLSGCELHSLKGVKNMNCPEFRAAIARSGTSIRDIAIKIGISEQALYNKLSGKTEFKNSEIQKLAETLSLSMNAVNVIFFDGEVN